MKRSLSTVLVLAAIGMATPALACKEPSFTKAERALINPNKLSQKLYSSAATKVTNYYRCKAGKTRLKEKSGLRSAAASMSSKMARKNKVYHDSKTQRRSRYRKGRIKTRVYAENIALDARLNFGKTPFIERNDAACQYLFAHNKQPIGQHSYASMALRSVANWVNSPEHRVNMMHPMVKTIGNGIAYNAKANQPCGGYYMTQNFAD